MRILELLTSTIILGFLALIWYAFILTKLWAWFIIPFFHLAALPLGIAIGLMMIKNLFFIGSSSKEVKTIGELFKTVLTTMFGAGFLLAFAKLVVIFL